MKLDTRARVLRRLLYAALLAALLLSGSAVTPGPAAAQYPYGCDCTKLYSEAHAACSSRGGLKFYQCNYTYNGRTGNFTCNDGSQWTNSCTY